ncbi:polysaccharide deacetylase family protein [Brevundimonas sp. SL130]|uniref:polysaccharide deacetylase family protein n=1 Tax=Brevundimonas sp. SL130 TaxID=2995143 RepID=UPI00226D2395|nr:polysaccharide deacetylase family protein [Brevundimonas sp. SL130]WAC58604.1 polysaccharide deacetylase family protein [Brevundimonas sp. SL130]
MAFGARILAVLAVAVAVFTPTASFARPPGTKAIVVLTYDDALPSQLSIAVPALNAAGLPGVFFLSNLKPEAVESWRTVAADGHELANHTLFHPCLSATFPADPRNTLEAYTPHSLLQEIAQANTLLTAIDGKMRHGYAMTCGQTVAGGQDYIEPLRQSGLVTYARSVSASSDDLRRDISSLDRMNVPAAGFAEDATAQDLIAFAEQARAGGGMAVFLFHGVGGDHIAVSEAAHAELLAWLAAHRDTIWTTTLQEAFDWIDATSVGSAASR